MAQATVLQKRCSCCKEMKPVSEFYRCAKWRDGLDYNCKPCRKAMNLRSVESRRKYPEKLAKMQATANRLSKAKYKSDPERRARIKVYKRKHYEANREQYIANVRKRNARQLGGGGSHSLGAWHQMLALFGGKCLCCGRTDRIARDHVVPLTRGGSDGIENIQPLCFWCNKSKFTQGRDYRTRDKVVLADLNAVGRLLFGEKVSEREQVALQKHQTASGYTGVYFAPKNENTARPWRAIIQVNRKPFRLGRFATKEEAAEAYNRAAREHLGEGAFQNEIR